MSSARRRIFVALALAFALASVLAITSLSIPPRFQSFLLLVLLLFVVAGIIIGALVMWFRKELADTQDPPDDFDRQLR